jgi:hypothetical protein
VVGHRDREVSDSKPLTEQAGCVLLRPHLGSGPRSHDGLGGRPFRYVRLQHDVRSHQDRRQAV